MVNRSNILDAAKQAVTDTPVKLVTAKATILRKFASREFTVGDVATALRCHDAAAQRHVSALSRQGIIRKVNNTYKITVWRVA